MNDNVGRERREFIEKSDYPEAIKLFEKWRPKRREQKAGPPLDQRVSLTVTDAERSYLAKEIEAIKKTGERVTASKVIRNRAMSNVDINGWADVAAKELDRLAKIEDNRDKLRDRVKAIEDKLAEGDLTDNQVRKLKLEEDKALDKLQALMARNEGRKNRLSGRMSLQEAETIKWRSERLSISVSDYLRIAIFDMSPVGSADRHMSLDSRRRFYLSILEIAENGWGEAPKIESCDRCSELKEENDKLKAEIRKLRRAAKK